MPALIRTFLFGVPLALTTACAAATQSYDGSSVAAEQDIRAQRSHWVEAVAEKDAAAMGRYYADSAVAVFTDSERIAGKEAILASWTELFSQASLSLVSQRIELGRTGDVALETASYQVWVPGSRITTIDNGRELIVWRKIEGDWRISEETLIPDVTPASGQPGSLWRRRPVLQLASR